MTPDSQMLVPHVSTSAALGLRVREVQVYAADWAQAFITGLLPFSIAVRIMAVCPSVLQVAEPADYISGSSAVQPANGIPLWQRLAFYNIGWNRGSKKPVHTKEGLAKEICDMVQELISISISISISIPIAIAIYIYIYSYSYLYL